MLSRSSFISSKPLCTAAGRATKSYKYCNMEKSHVLILRHQQRSFQTFAFLFNLWRPFLNFDVTANADLTCEQGFSHCTSKGYLSSIHTFTFGKLCHKCLFSYDTVNFWCIQRRHTCSIFNVWHCRWTEWCVWSRVATERKPCFLVLHSLPAVHRSLQKQTQFFT